MSVLLQSVRVHNHAEAENREIGTSALVLLNGTISISGADIESGAANLLKQEAPDPTVTPLAVNVAKFRGYLTAIAMDYFCWKMGSG